MRTSLRLLPLAGAFASVAATAGAQQGPVAAYAHDESEHASTIVVSDLAGGPTTTLPDGRVVPAYWPGGPRPTNPAQFGWPNGQTSANIQGPSDPRYATPFGTGYDGVARLLMYTGNTNIGACTGALIGDNVVLTAAHCVAGGVNRVDATFLGDGAGISNVTISATGVSNIITMPGYTGSVVDQRDLAILILDRPADAWVSRYRLYSENPLFKQVENVGFGSTGNGVTGAIFSNQFDANPTRRVAYNRYELTRDQAVTTRVYAAFNPTTPILVSDFDGADPGGVYPVARGSTTGWAARTVAQNNQSCNIFANVALDPTLRAQICQDGYGIMEGFTGSGDSGGANFIRSVTGELQIAAVTSFGNVACFPDQRLNPDGTPNPRTDSGCATGFVRYGSRFGMLNGHVWTGGAEQVGFVGQYSAYAVSSIVPEPSTYALLGTGLMAVGAMARRRRRQG